MGSERGLDPLAMLNIVESRYQSLLPGFSSVTTRLRLYSFHAWWVTYYMDAVHDPAPEAFNLFARRVEALYALTSAQDARETGVAGRIFANKKLASDNDVLDFRSETDAGTDRDKRYLQPLGGAFTEIYKTQMTESGLLGTAENHKLPVATPAGRALAEAFGTSIEHAGEAFLKAAEAGSVTRNSIAKMEIMLPSHLDQESAEADLLRALLMGEDGSPRSMARRASLLLILRTACDAGKAPVSENLLRWSWAEPNVDRELNETERAWQHYQSGDTTRMVYEALLRHATIELEDYPVGLSMTELCSLLASRLPDLSLADYLNKIDADHSDWTLEDLQADAVAVEAVIGDILAPLSRLRQMWQGRVEALAESYPDRPGYQTCYSELRWLEDRIDRPARTVIAELIRERVLRRHLDVAARKFYISQNYTFLVEIEDARLRARATAGVEMTGPRLGTALKFLDDVDFFREGKITEKAKAYLEAV